MDKRIIMEKLSTFITTELFQNPEYDLGDDEALISDGALISAQIIDSFAIAQLAVFIEREFELYILDTELTEENFNTLALMADTIVSRLERKHD